MTTTEETVDVEVHTCLDGSSVSSVSAVVASPIRR